MSAGLGFPCCLKRGKVAIDLNEEYFIHLFIFYLKFCNFSKIGTIYDLNLYKNIINSVQVISLMYHRITM